MTLWEYKVTKNDYKEEFLALAPTIEEEGWDKDKIVATVSDYFNGSIETYEKNYQYLQSNIAHFIILGMVCREFHKLRTKSELKLKNYKFDPDNLYFEEYIALHVTRKSLDDTAQHMIPEDREEFLADAQTVMDAIGLEIKDPLISTYSIVFFGQKLNRFLKSLF